MKKLRQFSALLTLASAAACGSSSESGSAPNPGADAGEDGAKQPTDAGSPTDPKTERPGSGDAAASSAGQDAGTHSDAGRFGADAGTRATDAGVGTDGGASVSCSPGVGRCATDRAEVCAASGRAYHAVECSTGCDKGQCNPLSLATGWAAHQYQLLNDSITTPAAYSFENNGLIATQSANPMASVYYNDTALPENVLITGRFGVHTTADDDLIGFVFGWADPEHYYLFDWKQSSQADATCGLSAVGASLKLVSADSEITDCTDLWQSAGTTKISPLVAVDQNVAGWKDNTDYDLRLEFRPGNIKISVTEVGGAEVVSISSNDTTYRAGKFGFYNYSQEAVRYEFFAISPAP